MPNSENQTTLSSLQLLVPRLQQTAGRIIGRNDLADDAVQDALIVAAGLSDRPENLEAWFYRTVVHRSLAARRAALRRANHEQSASQASVAIGRHPDPVEALQSKELMRHIVSALSRLPAEQRMAFILFEIEGLDYETIAARQDVPLGTVRSRLNRARRALRRHLAVYRGECPECQRLD